MGSTATKSTSTLRALASLFPGAVRSLAKVAAYSKQVLDQYVDGKSPAHAGAWSKREEDTKAGVAEPPGTSALDGAGLDSARNRAGLDHGAPSDFTINHVGLAVPDIEKFLDSNKVLYASFKRTDLVVNDRQQVREVFLTDGKTVIELLQPVGDSSPLAGFLRKNASGGLVHVCFECDDISVAIRRIKEAGGLLISGPTPDVAFAQRPIAFLMLANQVIEIVERRRRPSPAAAP